MKSLFVIITLLFSINILACQRHKIDFLLEEKKFLTTDDYQLNSLKKDNSGKWILEITLYKKNIKKIADVTKKNIGKYLNVLFDKQPIASYQITTEMKLPNGRLELATTFDDLKAVELQKECQHSK